MLRGREGRTVWSLAGKLWELKPRNPSCLSLASLQFHRIHWEYGEPSYFGSSTIFQPPWRLKRLAVAHCVLAASLLQYA